jgi:hypothetical protein
VDSSPQKRAISIRKIWTLIGTLFPAVLSTRSFEVDISSVLAGYKAAPFGLPLRPSAGIYRLNGQ